MSLAVLVAGCEGNSGTPPPSVLVDGSHARSLPITFAELNGPILTTRARAIDTTAIREDSRAGACLAGFRVRPGGDLVQRVGADGVSITFVDAEQRTAYSCDGLGDAWCARAVGRLVSGRLRDPRVTMSCRAAGQPLAFAWIEPSAHAAYVVVRQRGYFEVYPTAPGLPVRATTLDIDLETARAMFDIREYARDGRMLRAYELSAHVAG